MIELEQLRLKWAITNEEMSQQLGQVLGFPWYKDDQINFPGSTEVNGVCTGELVLEDLVELAAKRIKEMQKLLEDIRDYDHDEFRNSPVIYAIDNYVDKLRGK